MGPEGELAAAELTQVLRGRPGGAAGRGTNRDRPRVSRGADADGDRRAARMAARHRQDADAASPAASARGAGRGARPGCGADTDPGADPRTNGTMMGDDGPQRGARAARGRGDRAGRPRAADGRRHADGVDRRRSPGRLRRVRRRARTAASIGRGDPTDGPGRAAARAAASGRWRTWRRSGDRAAPGRPCLRPRPRPRRPVVAARSIRRT